MGVDATIYVMAPYSQSDLAYGDACICLRRRRDDWTILDSLPKSGKVPALHIMHATWAKCSDGTRPGDPDREGGYLFGDSYTPDGGFTVYEVASLAPVLLNFSEYNRKILAFILATYPKHKFLIIWS